MNTITETKARLVASPRAWMTGEALRQFHATARLDGVRFAVGFPDLHPGQGRPVGAAFVTRGVIHPRVIGDDIGCGMALFKIGLLRREAQPDRWAELRFNLEHSWEEGVDKILAQHQLVSTCFDEALGTVGGGNHFVELQEVEKIFDVAEFKRLGVGKEQLVLLVHSGSRGLGETVQSLAATLGRENGLAADSALAQTFLRDHDLAVRWARVNRVLLAQRFANMLGADAELAWDGCHNSITPRETEDGTVWIHRKGAVAAEDAAVVIAGSRGTLSYLVKPRGDGRSHAWSLAHGAGRKWARSVSRLRMRERFGARQLARTAWGGRVVCEQRDLLYEEAPDAYKNIETVIEDLVDAGLISVIASLRPLLTYKTRATRR